MKAFFLVLILLMAAGCGQRSERISPTATATVTLTAAASSTPEPKETATATATFTPLPTATPTGTPTPTPSPTATETTTPLPLSPTPEVASPTTIPATPQPYLATYRLVTYYGSPLGPGLGILGNNWREETLRLLREVAAEYQALSPEHTVVPTYHMVTTVADSHPGPLNYYSHWLELAEIEEWIAAAEAEGVAVILDIQPGRADIQAEFERVRHLLYRPFVHLALDPEYAVGPDQVPGTHLGSLDAAQINGIQVQLNAIAQEIGWNKVLIVHQFEASMIANKGGIADLPYVELVIDADGFGISETKIADYDQHAAEPGFEYGGIKLFYQHDAPLLTPSEVMALVPPPAVVIYQ